MTGDSKAGGAVAIVTGAASGMGAATAQRLSHDGCRVVLVDLDVERAEQVASTLAGEALAVRADVAEEDDVDAYLQAALARFGRVDRVFLNAGVGRAMPLIDESVTEFDRIVRIDLRSVFLGLRSALRQMREQGAGGAIVVTASTAALAGSDLAAYSAAKHGAWALVRTAAIESAAFGVRVNAVAPGSIDTPMMRALEQRLGGDSRAVHALHATTPLGRHQDRYGSPEELARVVAFLLDDASSWITGVALPVDGGVLATDPYRLPESLT